MDQRYKALRTNYIAPDAPLEESVDKWILKYDLDTWTNLDQMVLRQNLKSGACMLIQDTKLNAGWNWDMKSACKIKSGASFVEAQGIAVCIMWFSRNVNACHRLLQPASARWNRTYPRTAHRLDQSRPG